MNIINKNIEIPPIEYINTIQEIEKLENIRDGKYSSIDKKMKKLKEDFILLKNKNNNTSQEKRKMVQLEVKYGLLNQEKYKIFKHFEKEIFNIYKDFFANYEPLIKQQISINLDLFIEEANKTEIIEHTIKSFLRGELDFLNKKDIEILKNNYSSLYFEYLCEILH